MKYREWTDKYGKHHKERVFDYEDALRGVAQYHYDYCWKN